MSVNQLTKEATGTTDAKRTSRLARLSPALLRGMSAALPFVSTPERTGGNSPPRWMNGEAGQSGRLGSSNLEQQAAEPSAGGQLTVDAGDSPRVVGIGGGTGLSRLLRGLKTHVDDLTAIVTVTDDGGSSGRLRRGLGVLPPGDFRQCIAALADAEPMLVQLFEHRFRNGEDLKGHSFGNLFITAMSEITGSFEMALQESGRVLAVRGQILPSTFDNVALCAELANGRVVKGESELTKGGSPIKRVYLDPESPKANPKVGIALGSADLIIVGPGSLYTSVLPNLVIPEIGSALEQARALKIYVCNVATQPGETDGYDLEGHVRAIESHVGPGVIDLVLANGNFLPPISANWPACHVSTNGGSTGAARTPVRKMDLIDEDRPTQHHPQKLGQAIVEIASQHFNGTNGTRNHHTVPQPASAARSKPGQRM